MARYCGGCARRRGPGDSPCPVCSAITPPIWMPRDTRKFIGQKHADMAYAADRQARDAEYVAEHGASALVTKKAYDEEVLGDLF